MLALRFAAVLGLVFWVGGLLALGAVAAPAIFEVLGAAKGVEGRALAGAAFGQALGRFQTATYFCGALIVASLVVRAVLGPRPRRFSLRLAILAAMIAMTTWSGMVLLPRMQNLQTAQSSVPGAGAAVQGRRAEFQQLHSLSTSLQLVPLLGGIALLFFELRD